MPKIGDWKLVAPEWPHIKGQRVRVYVGEVGAHMPEHRRAEAGVRKGVKRYLFGNVITGDSKVNTVLCDGGQIVQTAEKGDVQ